ncbi:hypothetical protein Lesp02_27850 [Lentzea sp. NBRC 105346]|uniref:sunset domain-containing protein n=1 Tax=Lentzea sp. NBRC 105346 TaxID=3032205 RepID=UPI0025542E88|nr:hypothetical protein [Lentzea sp. NBRC 105346]GLZ30596.1 hypothetical protein Lesp02_27850 [Lentzea sp. NBRC 105346]
MSIFGQVWLWSLLAFVTGVLLTWVILVRPVRKQVAHLEDQLLQARSAPAPVVAAPADDFIVDDWEPAPSLADEVLVSSPRVEELEEDRPRSLHERLTPVEEQPRVVPAFVPTAEVAPVDHEPMAPAEVDQPADDFIYQPREVWAEQEQEQETFLDEAAEQEDEPSAEDHWPENDLTGEYAGLQDQIANRLSGGDERTTYMRPAEPQLDADEQSRLDEFHAQVSRAEVEPDLSESEQTLIQAAVAPVEQTVIQEPVVPEESPAEQTLVQAPVVEPQGWRPGAAYRPVEETEQEPVAAEESAEPDPQDVFTEPRIVFAEPEPRGLVEPEPEPEPEPQTFAEPEPQAFAEPEPQAFAEPEPQQVFPEPEPEPEPQAGFAQPQVVVFPEPEPRPEPEPVAAEQPAFDPFAKSTYEPFSDTDEPVTKTAFDPFAAVTPVDADADAVKLSNGTKPAPLPKRTPAEPVPQQAEPQQPVVERPRSLFEPILEADDGPPLTETKRPEPPASQDQPFVPTFVPGPPLSEQAAEPAPPETDLPRRETSAGLPIREARRSTPPRPFQTPAPAPQPAPTPAPVRPTRPRPVGFSPSTGGNGTPTTRYQQPEGFNPRSPFGPGSVLPRSDGHAPAEDFAVKATLTGRRYYTNESANFTETRADVWFRTVADAQKAGFRPAP